MWKKILISLGVFSATILIVSIYLFASINSQIKAANYSKASRNSKIALAVINPVSKITFSKIASIELAKQSLVLIRDLPVYFENLVNLANLDADNNYIFDIKKFTILVNKISHNLQNINDLNKKPFLIKNLIAKDNLTKLETLSKNLPDIIGVLESFSQKDQKIIIVFQNSDEIRATGGFMGSYAILNIVNGKIIDISVEDIYDAEGQFEGFIEAPNGVKEYLSDNKGLRISNSNWHPDFPTSAEQTLQFFALGNKKNVTTLVAINQDYAKILLDIIGEINLRDYNTIVNSNNISEVLRSRRSEFFPGSKQKKHLLSQLLTQLQIKVAESSEQSKFEIIKQTLNQINLKNIQLYSANDEVDKIFTKYDFRQEMEYKDNADYLLFSLALQNA